MRLDQYLVNQGIVPSRTKAKELIETEQVEVFVGDNWQTITKSSFSIEGQKVRLKSHELIKYVARSGLKLESAIKKVDLDVADSKFLDVGQSTGGFTDCLLQLGVSEVIGIDVGHDQLAEKIKDDAKVKSFEGINAREMSDHEKLKSHLNSFDGAVVDVSFISLKLILPEAVKFLKPNGILLALVKPQFEVGAENLRDGIVKDHGLFDKIKVEILEHCKDLKLQVLDYFASSVPGRDGNQEFFVYGRKEA